MKKYILLVSAVILTTNLLKSQTASEDDFSLKTFGIGVGFQTNDNFWFQWTPSSNLIFTFNIKDVFRIEPEIGFSFYKREENMSTSTDRDYLFALNSYYILKRNKVCMLPGLKIGYTINKEYSELWPDHTRERESNSITFGPILGIEYFFTRHFSIGGELGMLYISQKYKKTYSGDKYKEKHTKSTAEIKFHFYF